MKLQTAVFIGHSYCPEVDKDSLKCEIEKLIKLGVTNFLNGGQGGFDQLSAVCVYELKKKYPHIMNFLIVPYLSFYTFDEKVFDEIIYPYHFQKYTFRTAIPKRNQYMVEHANYAVCYVTHNYGGAAKTYHYAVKKGLNIINLA